MTRYRRPHFGPTIRDARKAFEAAYPGLAYEIVPAHRWRMRQLAWTGGPQESEVWAALVGSLPRDTALSRRMTPAEEAKWRAEQDAEWARWKAEAPAREAARKAEQARRRAEGAKQAAETRKANAALAARLSEAFPGVVFTVSRDRFCVSVVWVDGPEEAAVRREIGGQGYILRRLESEQARAVRLAAEQKARDAAKAKLAAKRRAKRAERARLLGRGLTYQPKRRPRAKRVQLRLAIPLPAVLPSGPVLRSGRHL